MSQGSPLPSYADVDESRLPPRRYRELERVSLLVDVPEEGLKRGESGTIVHAMTVAEAYLVEFVNPEDGSTRALIDVTPDQICLAKPRY